ncbi:hypothetical protein K525DRAFT_266210 [Schizophyllum commune Loenen D]|nr:hypothetical protein K525DRAFT_266210 [Schizophyllum commune Loenen D]
MGTGRFFPSLPSQSPDYDFSFSAGHVDERFGAGSLPNPVEGSSEWHADDEDLDTAAVWAAYVQEASAYDRERFSTWNQRLDVQLLFNGLYVAVTMPLLAETSHLLQVDFPTRAAYVTNTALAVGTTLSVMSAVLCLHCKHWLGGYKAEGLFRGATERDGNIQQASRLRQYRHDGLQRFRVPTIIDSVALLIYFALVAFAIGLIAFLWDLARFLAFIVLALCLFVVLFHVVTTMIQCVTPQAPYRTPLAEFLTRVWPTMARSESGSGNNGRRGVLSPEEREMENIGRRKDEWDGQALRWLRKHGRWVRTRRTAAMAEAKRKKSEQMV